MDFLSLIPTLANLLDRILPDPAAAAAAKMEVLKLQVSDAEFTAKLANDLTASQINVDATEADSSSVFVSGWRPAIGWCCGLAFGVSFVIMPLVTFICAMFGHTVVGIPTIDMSAIMPVLLGMLGLGGMRTFEKIKGVARS